MNYSTANLRVMKMITLFFLFTKEKKGEPFAQTFHTMYNSIVQGQFVQRWVKIAQDQCEILLQI